MVIIVCQNKNYRVALTSAGTNAWTSALPKMSSRTMVELICDNSGREIKKTVSRFSTNV